MTEIQTNHNIKENYELFANNFWVYEVGYETIMLRLRQAKQTCEDVKHMFHERSLIEEDYAKRLMKLSKKTTKQEIEITAKEHLNLSQKIKSKLEQELNDFLLKQKEQRKSQQSIAERSLRNKLNQAVLLQKAKEKYDGECVKVTGLLASKNSVIGKESDKLSLKIERTQINVNTASQEYRQLVKIMNDINDKWIYDWKIACDKFQTLEEERIEHIKKYLWVYANFISEVFALESCEVNNEIQLFIKEHATGSDLPESPAFINFFSGNKENDTITSKRASFGRITDLRNESSSSSSKNHYIQQLQQKFYPTEDTNNISIDGDDNYNKLNDDRASLYANTISSSNLIKNKNEFSQTPVDDDKIEEEEEEPIDPRSKKMLSIGNNVFEVDPNCSLDDNKNQNPLSINRSYGTRKPMPVLDKPQPPTPVTNNIINQNQNHNSGNLISGPGDLRRKSLSSTDHGPISSQQQDIKENMANMRPHTPLLNNQPSNNIIQGPGDLRRKSLSSTDYGPISSQQQEIKENMSNMRPHDPLLNNQPSNNIIQGPGDLRRKSLSSTDYGPVSSQQQEIKENMSNMRSHTPLLNNQPNNNIIQAPGDLRKRLSISTSASTSITAIAANNIINQQQQDNLVTNRRSSSPNSQQQRNTSPVIGNNNNNNNNKIERSDTIKTSTTSSSGSNSLGILLDAQGRVKQDDLAEAYFKNGGKLPPENIPLSQSPSSSSPPSHIPGILPNNHSNYKNIQSQSSIREMQRSNTIKTTSSRLSSYQQFNYYNNTSTVPPHPQNNAYQQQPPYQQQPSYHQPYQNINQSLPRSQPQLQSYNSLALQQQNMNASKQNIQTTIPEEISFNAGDIIAVLGTFPDGCI
ncbi:15232_t:CDS:10 [Entrophospora sp. SA101]|nr:15711_t:CDS:10 [Entrophospora sp. SA101]CAJ0750287.1 7468_t:CDS:10 [Entrophospora sp. SA101]CAJ0768027.1 15232_t:CDS:10 [Entrophospora sp. SA101]